MLVSVSGFVTAGIIACVNTFIMLMVLSRNARSAEHRWFCLMTAGITGWAVSSIISDSTMQYDLARYTSFLAYGSSFLGLIAAYMFAGVLRNGRLQKSDTYVLAVSVPLGVLFSTPLVYDLVTIAEYQLGALYNVYLLAMFLALGGTVIRFIQTARRTPAKRQQAFFILAGFFSMVFLALITNAVIPALVNTTTTTKIGPIFSVLFIAATAYAIIRHKLFDIRFIVARSVGYVLLLSTLIGIYSIAVYGIAGGLYAESEIVYRITPLIAALFIAFTAPYFRRKFDRITNNIFFRDSYDPQVFLDHLNKTIITNIELGILLRRAASVIEEFLKSDYVVFGIYSNQDMTYRVVGTDTKVYTGDELQTVSEGFERLQTRVITTDSLDRSQVLMQKILSKNDIAVAVRLSSVLDSDNHTTGYLFLGHKKSGNTYNKQDLRIIEIVADELVIAVQNSLRFEEIQQFNVTLQNRINQATTKVKKSNEKLQALDQTKDDFISMASHQLRTPLTSMKGYISMVLDGDVGEINDNQRRMLQQAFISSQRMTYLISDLLNLSRLKTGKFVMDVDQVDLVRVVEQEVAQLHESASNRDLTLEFDPPKSFPVLELDETKIRQVIMNFLDNAIYYTLSGGKITVELAEKPNNIEFTVTDSGIGVPKNQQHHLFSKFYRAPNAKQARPDGTGLGLYMAKKVVVGQGGAVIFRSSEGKGSTFGFSFPKQKHIELRDTDD
jgi:signal transduction histidine kinase